ncbi:hypothetical protein HGA34_04175 [Candidatus Falkowbacteria bacterium]|nr:hypothetical protein [Candidatus Falkowbacteria bacterium]
MAKKEEATTKISARRRPKVALALGGGGARGLAHVGVLRTLEAAGITIDAIVATSMGAIVGACHLLGRLDHFETEARGFNKRKAIKEIVDLAVPKYSLLKGKKAHRYIEKLVGRNDFNHLSAPLWIIATNLADGQPVIINKGNLANAIQASIAVPGVFPPVKLGDDYLVDGGVASPTPIAEALAWGADIVIAVDLVLKRGSKLKEKPDLIFTMMQSYETIRNKSVWDGQTEHQKVVTIRPDLNGNGLVSSFKFFKVDNFISAGAKAAIAALPEIREAIDNF